MIADRLTVDGDAKDAKDAKTDGESETEWWWGSRWTMTLVMKMTVMIIVMYQNSNIQTWVMLLRSDIGDINDYSQHDDNI